VVVADDGAGGSDAVVIDAGAGVAASVAELIRSKGWTLRAVLATHGHADHTWDAGPLCAEFDVPFRIHAADAYRIADPLGTLAPKDAVPDMSVAVAIQQAVRSLGESVADYQAPARIETFQALPGEVLQAGAIKLRLIPAPGHTEGSSIYIADDISPADEPAELDAAPSVIADSTPSVIAESTPSVIGDSNSSVIADTNSSVIPESTPSVIAGSTRNPAPTKLGVAFTGDVLFAGSIGRTDLPGGDYATMADTLTRLKSELDPTLGVIPGHGPATTVAYELATNPYLR